MPEVFVETVLDGQRGEDGVVDQGGPEVGERARRVSPGVLVEVSGDHVVEDGVAEELEPLVAVSEPVGVERGMGEGLQQVGAVAEAVPDGGLEGVVTPEVSFQTLPIKFLELGILKHTQFRGSNLVDPPSNFRRVRRWKRIG